MNIKRYVTISLFVFWACVTAILTGALVIHQLDKQSQPTPSPIVFDQPEVTIDPTSSPLENSATPTSTTAPTVTPRPTTNTGTSKPTVAKTPTPTPKPATPTPTPAGTQLSMSEVAKHNSSSSCWLLISNKVYDVTTFIDAHPGSRNDILKNCGKESSQAFATQGGEGSHSSTATQMLAVYFIGNFGSTMQ